MQHLYSDTFADLAKAMEKTEGPSEEQIAKATALTGKRVTIGNTGYVGTVVGPNLKQGGFYNGGRYPVLVCVDKVLGGDTNVTFEYTLEELFIC